MTTGDRFRQVGDAVDLSLTPSGLTQRGVDRSRQETRALRRKPRHSGIFQAIRALDTQLDATARRELADWIAERYRVEYGSVLLGMVAVCCLGAPFVDHRLDLIGGIIDHFAATEPMPSPYDAARMLARSPSYVFVEVHSDGTIIPVLDDGSIV